MNNEVNLYRLVCVIRLRFTVNGITQECGRWSRPLFNALLNLPVNHSVQLRHTFGNLLAQVFPYRTAEYTFRTPSGVAALSRFERLQSW